MGVVDPLPLPEVPVGFPGMEAWKDISSISNGLIAELLQPMYVNSWQSLVLLFGELASRSAVWHAAFCPASAAYGGSPSAVVRWLDFFCHGQQSLVHPIAEISDASFEDGVLVLGNGDGSGGFLLAREVMSAPGPPPLAVILHACSMSQGRSLQGGSTGMAQACLAWGARATMTTLWSLPATDARLHKLLLYRHLQPLGSKKPCIGQAMSCAARAMHQVVSGVPNWAVFVLHGVHGVTLV